MKYKQTCSYQGFKYPDPDQSLALLALKIEQEPRSANLLQFLRTCWNFLTFNFLQRYIRVSLFLALMWPREQISSGMLEHLYPFAQISAARNSYLSHFLLLAVAMFLVKGIYCNRQIAIHSFQHTACNTQGSFQHTGFNTQLATQGLQPRACNTHIATNRVQYTAFNTQFEICRAAFNTWLETHILQHRTCIHR